MTATKVEENKNRGEVVFGQMPVLKAIAVMAIPTVISQLITVIYNIK